jgi:hypothetical protein
MLRNVTSLLNFCRICSFLLSRKPRGLWKNYLSMALQPFVGPWPLLSFVILFTHTVGLLGRGISLSQGRCLHAEQHRVNAHRHPYLEWNSKPRPQSSGGRRQFMPYTARLLWSACGSSIRKKKLFVCLYFRNLFRCDVYLVSYITHAHTNICSSIKFHENAFMGFKVVTCEQMNRQAGRRREINTRKLPTSRCQRSKKTRK